MSQKIKKFGVNSTILLTSLSLAACGGGGGYYGDNSSGNSSTDTGSNDSTTDVTNTPVSLQTQLQDTNSSVIQLAQDASSVQFAVTVLNSDKGGIAEKDVRLSISDSENIGVTSTSSKVTTNDNGTAIFTINIPTLNAESGKVTLTAIVDGTTISTTYTLNISKTTTMISDYNLSIPQGLILNLPLGAITAEAVVTDTRGGGKSGQTVQLALPEAMKPYFTMTSSSVTTDDSGKATFTISANSNLTSSKIAEFVNTSQVLTYTLIDENKAQKVEKASLTFKDVSTVVNNLEITKPDESIYAKGGVATVKVYAKNSDGKALSNKTIALTSNVLDGVTIDNVSATTNASGYVEFKVSVNSSTPVALSQSGIVLTAKYNDGNNSAITATATLQVSTADSTAENQEAIQRLEIASSYQVNASDDSVTITVKGVNNRGEGATQGDVTLSLNTEALSNGVTFEGNAKQSFKNGYVSYTLKTSAKTEAAINALVTSGIKATFTADNNITNTINIDVTSEVQAEDEVRYLTFDPVAALDYTQTQNVSITVQAIATKDDGGLAGQSISLKRIGLSDAQLDILHLSAVGSLTKVTDENGYATFNFKYTYTGEEQQQQLALTGIKLLATATNGKTQTLSLNFKEPSVTNEIVLESLDINTVGVASLELNKTTELTVTVNATGSDGKVFANQKIGLGLNEAALQNGAVISGGATQSTDANGRANFKILLTPKNSKEIENLIASGLTIAAKGSETTISATRSIQLNTPAIVYQDLAGLELSYDTVSVLGGETRVKVVAKDAAGNSIANTPLAIGLSSLASSRVSLSDVPTETNSKGEAEFTVTVSEGEYDPSLIKNGILFAVVGTNLNSGDRIQQTGTIQVTVPQDVLTPRLSADLKTLSLGATAELNVAVKDELGIYTAGTPVRLSLNQEAIKAGVKLSSDLVSVVSNGNVAISLVLPKGTELNESQKNALLNSGITVTGTMNSAKGEVITTTLHFDVEELINTNHLLMNSSKTSIDVNGDKAIVTVTLLDQNNRPVVNQNVKLSANNAATLIIGTPGSGQETNTSDPQTVFTDSNGNAFFSVEIDATTVDKELLLASGLELTASNTNADGVISQQVFRIATVDASSTTTLQPARYSLRIQAAKPTLNVRSDTSDVIVTLLDTNGGGVTDQYIYLSLDNFNLNGTSIVGPSGLTTDENGQAVFKVKVDETARNASYTAAEFASDDLKLTTTFKEAGYSDATQVSTINIVQAVIENPVASIVIGVNPTEVGTSSDGVYYTRNLSVSVTDFDGKPLASQEVVMDIKPTTYLKGIYSWDLVTDVLGNQSQKWVNHPSIGCSASDTGTAITNGEVTNIPVKVPTFLGSNASTTATYTTDSEGKFDFTIRYPKIYAQWLNVQIGASSTVASLPTRTVYNLGLPSLTNDYSTDGTYGPNLTSPYGTQASCP
ncbi:beta strand repeat-containing protein [Acinetobacter puyangensis]|uniref:beta strand repeat-containing protein n=1 Tax=Acinetobacter puyangensis TaxID=1096779 RepID=UPI003A4DDE92